jgi:CRP-like cAMP-binding protein
MDRLTPTLERLVRLPLFADCTVKELALVANRTTTVNAQPGDVLMREGTTGRELVIIVEGTANVFVEGELIATLGPGDVCGEIALLDHGPRSATVVAETRLVAEVCTPPEFSELLESVPSFTAQLLAQMADRLRGQLARA